jgi:CubicO group peptidase (beta-lactamase class C family)
MAVAAEPEPPFPVTGTVEPGWEPVRDAFQANLDAGMEVGAAVALYHRGRPVVDLHAGAFDRARTRPYDEDVLQLVFSTTKGITAIALALCVQRGLLDYDDLVVDHWPEFGQAGKGEVTVAQLISHQAGLVSVDGPLALADALDWDGMVARLARQAPYWPPGTGHGYHALTFGWLAGELVRRVDPEGRTLGGFVADEVVAPLGAELWIGLPGELESRVSPLIGGEQPADAAVRALLEQFMGPDTLAGKALFLNGAFSNADAPFNQRAVHAAELPAANAITNARSLARIYASTIGEVDGIRLLEPATVARASSTATRPDEPDQVLVYPSTFGMGFMTSGTFTPMLGSGSFGHAGAGGSLAFAQPASEIAFAYVMNRMDNTLNGDVRALTLVNAVAHVLRG